MSNFLVSQDDELDLVIYAVTGVPDRSDIINSINETAALGERNNRLWDFSAASLHAIDFNDIMAISMESALTDHLKTKGCVIIVTPAESGNALAKYYRDLSNSILERPIEFHLAASKEDGIQWLNDRLFGNTQD